MYKEQIKLELKKELGYTSKEVLVSESFGGYDRQITFKIKDLEKVDFKKLERFKNKIERVDYCESSGEILAGGNIYAKIEFWDKRISQAIEDIASDSNLICLKDLTKEINGNREEENISKTIGTNNNVKLQYINSQNPYGNIDIDIHLYNKGDNTHTDILKTYYVYADTLLRSLLRHLKLSEVKEFLKGVK